MKALLDNIRLLVMWGVIAYFVYIIFVQNVPFPSNCLNLMIVSILLLIISNSFKQIDKLEKEIARKEEIIDSMAKESLAERYKNTSQNEK